MDGKEIEMFSHDHLYELIQDYQREAREAADRERLVHEAEEMQPESLPLRARLGVRLVEWGRRLQEESHMDGILDGKGSPCAE